LNKDKIKKLESDLSLVKTSNKDLKKEVNELKKRVRKLEKSKKGISEAALRRAFF
jgi:polyhydroxyalkanoate synthesis regulator phasin